MIRKLFIAFTIVTIFIIVLTIGASADGLLVGNVQADVFEYVDGTTTSIQDMIVTFDVMPTQQIENNDYVLVWASLPIVIRTFDGVTTQSTNAISWYGETSDIDGIRLSLKLEQWLNGARKGLRLYCKVLSWPETEYSYITENQYITIYGENGGTIQCSINILPYMLNIQEDVDSEDLYKVGYQNGYTDGQNNPNTAIKDSYYNNGYQNGLMSNVAYLEGYSDGANDVGSSIEVSGLAKAQTAIGVVLTPINTVYNVVNRFFNSIYDNPVGAIIIWASGAAIAVACVIAVGKFFIG